jgi:hypothetical protein
MAKIEDLKDFSRDRQTDLWVNQTASPNVLATDAGRLIVKVVTFADGGMIYRQVGSFLDFAEVNKLNPEAEMIAEINGDRYPIEIGEELGSNVALNVWTDIRDH